jgi:hypothetical protein
METETFISILASLGTQIGTLIAIVWWLSKRIDKLEAKFDARLNNGINSRIINLDERLSHMEGRFSVPINKD